MVSDHFPLSLFFSEDVRGSNEDSLRYPVLIFVLALLVIVCDREILTDLPPGSVPVLKLVSAAPTHQPCSVAEA